MPFNSRDLQIEVLDPGAVELVRLFRYPGGDWDPPDLMHRNLRVDPPPGHKDKFAVLYTADSLVCVAQECRILSADIEEKWLWRQDAALQYEVVRYQLTAPSLFVPIDRNAALLGLEGARKKLFSYEPYQQVALELLQRFGTIVHGLSWASFHRSQMGRVYAIWHHHKATIGLRISSPVPYAKLGDDKKWQDLVDEYDFKPIAP